MKRLRSLCYDDNIINARKRTVCSGKGTGMDVGLKTFMSDLEQRVAFICQSLHVFLPTVMLTEPPQRGCL